MFKEERNKNFPIIQMICDSQGYRYVDENNQTCEPKDQKEISVAEYSKDYIKQKLILKACEWLKKNRDELSSVDTSGFIELFKKAMEE